MIEWTQIDNRLAAAGKDRAWLAEQVEYSADTIRTALAPASTKRSDRMLAVLSRAIEDEEAAQRGIAEAPPGVFDIFTGHPEVYDRADRASRIVQAESLTDFCRDVIASASDEILAREFKEGYFLTPPPSQKVAETGLSDSLNPIAPPDGP